MKNTVIKLIFIFLSRDDIHIADKSLFKLLLAAYLRQYTVKRAVIFWFITGL